MAEHTLAILVKAIGAAQASKELKGVDSTLGRIGGRAKAGLGAAIGNTAKLAAGAAVGIGFAVQQGLSSLATLESAVTSVDGAIKQMGLTGKVSGDQIATWANEIEAATQAAFDDKDITSATANLIRYGSVSAKNLRPAMVVMTDLAAKTGSVKSASELLGKALADPTKAAGKLSRYGVILTKEQQKQIKAMTDAGKKAKAQALIIDILSDTTKNAARDSVGPYADSLNMLSDAVEDAEKALAIGFLPVITRVRDLLTDALADPDTLKNIEDFGKTLASGLDSLIDIAQNLPWRQIGDSMKLAGQGAKTVLNAFAGLPDWVQTAVLTGWGLNKLTGGALGGIVGELGKGLVKGVLGMTAGVVNLKAGVVNGGGVGGGGVGAGGGGMGLIATAATFGAAGAGSTVGNSLLTQATDWVSGLLPDNAELRAEFKKDMGIWIDSVLPTPGSIQKHIENVLGFIQGPKPTTGGGGGMSTILGPLRSALRTEVSGVVTKGIAASLQRDLGKLETLQGKLHNAKEQGDRQRVRDLTTRVGRVEQRVDTAKQSITSATVAARDAARHAGETTTGAVNALPGKFAAAMRPPIVNVTTNVSVTPAGIQKSTTTQNHYGPANGSAGGGNRDNGHGH